MLNRNQNGPSWSIKKLVFVNLVVFIGFCFFYFNSKTETFTSFSSKNSFLFNQDSTLNKSKDPTPSSTEEYSPMTHNSTQNETKEDSQNFNNDKLKNSPNNQTEVNPLEEKEKDFPAKNNSTDNQTKEDPSSLTDELQDSSKNKTEEQPVGGKENPSIINNSTINKTDDKSLNQSDKSKNQNEGKFLDENNSKMNETEEKPHNMNDEPNDLPDDKTRDQDPKVEEEDSTALEKDTVKIYSNLHFQKMMPSDREGPSIFLTQGGIIDQKDARSRILCSLQQSQKCYSKTIAEHLDLVWAFSPIYSPFPEKMPFLYKTHGDYVGYMKSFGIKSVVLEAIYPGQNFTFTTAGNEPFEIQLEVEDYIYYRENFLNVAIRKTWHHDYEYILWIDAHQIFLNPYWWEDGIYKLARYPTVSFFQSLAHIQGSENNSTFKGGSEMGGVQYLYQQTNDINYWISGHGRWAAWNGNAVGVRREIYEKIDYIIDYCIEACCDCAFNAATMTSYWDLMDAFGGYGKSLKPWIEEAKKTLGGENGVVRGKMIHLYHEHIWHDGAVFRSMIWNQNLNLMNEMYRDENFTLHIKNESYLKTVKVKPDMFPVN